MAFVHKSERKLDYYNSGSSELGPGSYIKPKEYKKRQAYAPFSTTTERNITKPPLQTAAPGPGSYTKEQGATNAHEEKKPSAMFASNINRFADNSLVNSPGPGSYDLRHE